jgi:hypothetical protein
MCFVRVDAQRRNVHKISTPYQQRLQSAYVASSVNECTYTVCELSGGVAGGLTPVLIEVTVLEYHIHCDTPHTVAPPPHDGAKVSTPQLFLENSNTAYIVSCLFSKVLTWFVNLTLLHMKVKFCITTYSGYIYPGL